MKIFTVFIILNVCNIVCNIAMSIIVPFYPQFASNHNISDDIIGYIFSAHPLGQFFASLIFGKLITEHNRAKIMNIGIVLQGIELLTLGFLYFNDNRITIITISVLARVIGGFGASMFMTPLYAYIPLLFPDSIEQKIAITEVFTSIGFLIGPMFGSLLYELGGYTLPFFLFAGLSFLLGGIMPFNYKYLSPKTIKIIEIQNNIQENDELLQSIEFETEIEYKEIIKIYPIMIQFVFGIITCCVWSFYYPIMANYLEDQYNIKAINIGYFITINAITFLISSVYISTIKKYHRFYIYFGFLITGYLQFFMGPDLYFTTLSPNVWISFTVWGLIGIFVAFPYILLMPQLNILLLHHYPNQPQQCSNIASAVYNAGFSFGEFLGPIIGGYLSEYIDYQKGSSIFGIIMLVTAICYIPFLFNRKYI